MTEIRVGARDQCGYGWILRDRRANRPWYQFSLKAMLRVMLLFTVVFGFIGSKRYWERQATDGGGEHKTVHQTWPLGQPLRKGVIVGLSGATITDADLEDLEDVKNLVYVELRDTKVTDEGVKRLQKALPNCKIRH